MLDVTQPLDLLDRVGEGIFALDPDWRFAYLNRQAERVLSRLSGSPSPDLLGTVIWDRPALADSSLGRALHRAQVEQVAVVHEVPDIGSRGPVEVRAYPSQDGMTVLLRESPLPGHTAQVLDGMREAFVGCDHEWHITYVNATADGYLSPLGFGRAGLLGRNLWHAFPDLAGSRVQAEAFRAHAQGSAVELEEHFAAIDRSFSLRIAPTSDGMVCYAREIPARGQVERALQASEERFRILVESIDDVVFRLDREQRCVDAFGRWLEREGFSRGNLIGRTIGEIVGPEAASIHVDANLKALAGETVTYEWVLRSRRGVHHMQTTLSPLRGTDGEITGIVGVGRDVSERVEAERELRRAEEQIRQAQKMEAVGRLAGGVAHDFNNMTMIIMGFSDFLLSALERDDPRWADADEIRKAAERAMHLTRQLLGFGRQQLVARQVLSVNEVVSGMERMLRPLLGEDIRLVTRLSAGLGGVEADYGQLEQVVMNLALNAREAMRGGGRLTIETLDVDLPQDYAYRHIGIDIPAGPYVMLAVSDTGQGMTAEIKARLFEPFFTTKPTAQNTGLGLTTVYEIVVQSAGYIWVDSEPGKGTAFKICLPRVEGEDDVADPSVQFAALHRGSETILLVEDEEAVRSVASRVLTKQGYVVLAARNGGDALSMAEKVGGEIDLVLTDVVMPDVSGPELAERLLDRWPALKIVYMSGYAEGDKFRPAIQHSGRPFLQKPFSSESLLYKVREALDAGIRR